MPPKPKFTREEIINTALELVSKNGADSLTAKELGNRLGSSARPIFTVFKSMSEVWDEVKKAAMERFETFDCEIENIPQFKKVGMKMVMFARKEPNLYRLIFMSENETAKSFDDVFEILGKTAKECVENIREEYDLSEKIAKTLFENMWIYTFGIGTLCATGMCAFTEEETGKMLSNQFKASLIFANICERGD